MAAGSLARPHTPPQVPLSRRRWPRVAPVTPHPAAGVALAFPGLGPQAQRPQPWSSRWTHRSVSRRSRNFRQRAVAEASC